MEMPVQINPEIISLRKEIISLIENNPDIVIDEIKYGEIKDNVENLSYMPDAEEVEKFKDFEAYLREQVTKSGEDMWWDSGTENFEDFEQAINDTQADFAQLPGMSTEESASLPQPQPQPLPPLFVGEVKDSIDPEELEEIVRERMALLEEQYKQDNAKEADVIAKYEGIVQNMKEEDRLKYQTFVENIKSQWDNTIKEQETERKIEREVLYDLLNKNEDTIKTLQQELDEKQISLEQNKELDADTIQNLRTGIDDLRQKLRAKAEEFMKTSEEWNNKYAETELKRQEHINELTTKLQETISLSNESKDNLEKMLAERNAMLLKGREDLKKQEEISAKLTERIKELENKELNQAELEKWSKMETTLNSNIEKNKDMLDDQEQIKKRLQQRIEEFKDDPNYREQVNRSREELAELESQKQYSNPGFGLQSDEEESSSGPTSESIQTTTTEIGPGKNGIQEILVRIQYPTIPLSAANPGPVISAIGDTSVSTEAAVVGVMGEGASASQVLATNPGFNPPKGGGKNKNKNKTTRRMKNIYFTKDDFIAF